MKKLTKRFLATIFGLIIAFVLLEIGLRAGGFILLSMQRSDNQIPEDGVYGILALGESTTANLRNGQSSWPEELEKILNNRSTGMKFKVFNEGIPGITTTGIIENLQTNLDEYRPKIVIAMMGINDKGKLQRRNKNFANTLERITENLRTYELLALLRQAWENRNISREISMEIEENMTREVEFKAKETALKSVAEANPEVIQPLVDLNVLYLSHRKDKEAKEILLKIVEFSPDNPDVLRTAGKQFILFEDDKKAEAILLKALSLDPGNADIYYDLGGVYRRLNRSDSAIAMFEKVLQAMPELNEYAAYALLAEEYDRLGDNEKASKLYKEYLDKFRQINKYDIDKMIKLAEIYAELNRTQDALLLYEQAASLKPSNWIAQSEIALHHIETGNSKEAEKMLNTASRLDPVLAISIYQRMGERYHKRGMQQKADEMFNKAREIRSSHINLETKDNYRKLYAETSRRGMKSIIMQYPTLDINDAKAMFDEDEDIIFISNEENFNEALTNTSREELFIDYIGSFGHATLRGNRIIAENVANIVLNITN